MQWVMNCCYTQLDEMEEQLVPQGQRRISKIFSMLSPAYPLVKIHTLTP